MGLDSYKDDNEGKGNTPAHDEYEATPNDSSVRSSSCETKVEVKNGRLNKRGAYCEKKLLWNLLLACWSTRFFRSSCHLL